MKVYISRLLFDDYMKRGVFAYIGKAGSVDVAPEQFRELLHDAIYNADPECIDDMPGNYRAAYRRFVAQLCTRLRD